MIPQRKAIAGACMLQRAPDSGGSAASDASSNGDSGGGQEHRKRRAGGEENSELGAELIETDVATRERGTGSAAA